jgi:hypothetical protein
MREVNVHLCGRRIMLKRILIVLTTAVAVAAVAVGLYVRPTVKSVPRLFKRNAELKAQGYCMGESEFKMLAVQHDLNAGLCLKAFTALRHIRREMETTEGLVKMPQGASPAIAPIDSLHWIESPPNGTNGTFGTFWG